MTGGVLPLLDLVVFHAFLKRRRNGHFFEFLGRLLIIIGPVDRQVTVPRATNAMPDNKAKAFDSRVGTQRSISDLVYFRSVNYIGQGFVVDLIGSTIKHISGSEFPFVRL